MNKRRKLARPLLSLFSFSLLRCGLLVLRTRVGRIAFLGISRLDWRMRNATCSSPRPWSNEEKISLEVLLRLVEAEAVLEAGEGYGAEGCVGERPQGREQPGLRRETRGVGHPRRHGPRDAVGGELLGKLRPGPGARAHKREKHATRRR
jgi:hypothetical protein